jgi:hypothetical protein
VRSDGPACPAAGHARPRSTRPGNEDDDAWAQQYESVDLRGRFDEQHLTTPARAFVVEASTVQLDWLMIVQTQ